MEQRGIILSVIQRIYPILCDPDRPPSQAAAVQSSSTVHRFELLPVQSPGKADLHASNYAAALKYRRSSGRFHQRSAMGSAAQLHAAAELAYVAGVETYLRTILLNQVTGYQSALNTFVPIPKMRGQLGLRSFAYPDKVNPSEKGSHDTQ